MSREEKLRERRLVGEKRRRRIERILLHEGGATKTTTHSGDRKT